MLPGQRPDSGEPRPEILERSPGRWATPLLTRVPRWLLMTVAVALLAGGGAVLITSHRGHPPAHAAPDAHIVVIPRVCYPFIDMSGARYPTGYRVILGDAAVPPSYLGSQLPAGESNGPAVWKYGWKIAFGFRSGGLPVTISVPAAWRGRLALFGPTGGGFGHTSALRIPACPATGLWNVYVSSFFLPTPSGCVPLNVEVGRRTATVWFGLARHCPASLIDGRG